MPILNDRNRFSVTGASIIRRRNSNQVSGASDDSGEWDILPLVIEVNIFESIFDAAMSGSISIADTASLSSIINFQGQEILSLQWIVDDKEYNKNFYIWSVSVQNKSANTTTSTLVLEFVERHGYISEFNFLNGASAGNVADIIRDIMVSTLDVPLAYWTNADQNMRVMHNNRTPLQIVKWLTQRATNEIGEPMFCYASMPKNADLSEPESTNVRFVDLNTMLNTYEWEDEDTFRYSLTPNNDDAFRIDSVGFPENDNVFELAQRDSLFVSGINTTSMFDDGYHGYNEERVADKHRFRLSRESDWTMIEKQRFTISVPGNLFLSGPEFRGAGSMINIMIPKDQPSHTPSDNTIDAKRSGKFLIINQRHIMNAITGDYTIVMDIGRPDTPDDVNDETRYRTGREQRPR